MRPHVPPDFFWIVDAVELYQQIHKIFVLAPRLEQLGHARARESPEHRRPEGFQSGVPPHPEWRTCRKRKEVRQKVAHHVHHVDRRLLVRHRHVDVHPENQQRPRQLLQLFHDIFVALAG